MSVRMGGREIFVTCRAEEKYIDACLTAKFRGYLSQITWGLIIYNYKGPFMFFEKDQNDGHVNSEVYIKHVLPKMVDAQ